MEGELIIGVIHWFCIGTWIVQMVRLNKRKDKTPFLMTLILGLVTLFTIFLVGIGLFFWILVIISLFLGRSEEKQEDEKFYCNSCYITYNKEMFGAETDRWGKLCRYCLEKKHKEKEI